MLKEKNFLIEDLPYKIPEKFFFNIYNLPFSFYMDVIWNKKENYTICGFSPFLIFKSKNKNIEIEKDSKIKKFKAEPLTELQKIFNFFKFNSKYFFIPGGFGFLSYDLGAQIEKLSEIAEDDIGLPDIFICFYDSILVFDNSKRKCFFVYLGLEKNFKKKFYERKNFLKSILERKNPKIEKIDFKVETLKSNMGISKYFKSIEKIKNYIREGDVYQINFSHRFEIKGSFEKYQLFLKLKETNPAPYSGYFNFGNFTLISNSPELFLKKFENKILTKPMKGTRKREGNLLTDKKIISELLTSEKDRAELIMIVDLERNDLGKICEYGTVKVKKLINLEKYKTVFQTTSTIEGRLKKGINFKNIIEATFPGGSITGAPKKRAMEIIEELEPTKRNFYCGSFGYFGFNENLQLNILIRTLLLKNNTLYYPVGGGIVWDSIPEKEYEETFTKARNLFLSIGIKDEEKIRDIII
jgi:para-aminobenzoate synthetase component 1